MPGTGAGHDGGEGFAAIECRRLRVSAPAVIGWTLALILIGISFWIRRRRRARVRPFARSVLQRSATTASPKPSEALIYIEGDGTARELSHAEKTYVDTDFAPFDG